MSLLKELHHRITKENLWDKEVSLKRNELLQLPGAVDTHLYYIQSGSLKIYFVHQYEEHITRFAYKGNFIMALDSFITQKPTQFYIQALRQTHLKAVQKSNYLRFMNQTVENRKLWDNLMQMLLLHQIEREKDILISSPKKRYQRVLKRSPQLFQEIPHKHIASYLRMSPETLSRLQKY